jgi:hypothetical protein
VEYLIGRYRKYRPADRYEGKTDDDELDIYVDSEADESGTDMHTETRTFSGTDTYVGAKTFSGTDTYVGAKTFSEVDTPAEQGAVDVSEPAGYYDDEQNAGKLYGEFKSRQTDFDFNIDPDGYFKDYDQDLEVFSRKKRR